MFDQNLRKMTDNQDNIDRHPASPRANRTTKFDINPSVPTNLSSIKLLDGTNYGEWAERMEDILKCQGLWIIINNQEFEQNEAKRQWLEDKTLGTIKLAIDRKAVTIPKTINKPKELWDHLKDKFLPKDTMRCITLVRKFHSLQMSENETLPEFIHKVEYLASDLHEVGEDISDKMIAWTLLAGLPTRYDALVMGFAASHSRDTITADVVKRTLYFEDSRGTNEASSLTLPAHKAVMYSKPQQQQKCPNCQGIGHGLDTCSSPRGITNPSRPKQFKPWNKNKGKNKSKNKQADSSTFKKVYNNKVTSDNNTTNLQSKTGAHVTAVHSSLPAKLRARDDTTRGDATDPTATLDDDVMLVDSGASSTLISHPRWLSGRRPVEKLTVASASKSSNLKTNATGKLTFVSELGTVNIDNVTYVEGLRVNLLSVSQLTDADCKVIHDKSWCKIWHKPSNKLIGTAFKRNGLYVLNAKMKLPLNSALNTKTNSDQLQSEKFPINLQNEKADLWHKRLMHMAPSTMLKFHKAKAVRNYDLPATTSKKNKCEFCAQGNITRKPISKHSLAVVNEPLLTTVSDVCGPFQTRSCGGNLYFVTFIDVYSRYVHVAFIKHKSEVFEKFKEYQILAERQTGHKLKILRTDLGGEYCSKQFDLYLSQNGIKHETTGGWTPQFNGIAERMNRTLMTMVRSTLLSANIPHKFWGELVLSAAYILNRCTSKANPTTTPLQLWRGNDLKPTLKHLKTIGCLCYAKIPSVKVATKLHPKGIKCALLGYSSNSKEYRLWNLIDNKLIQERNVIFFEDLRAFSCEQVHPIVQQLGGIDGQDLFNVDDELQQLEPADPDNEEDNNGHATTEAQDLQDFDFEGNIDTIKPIECLSNNDKDTRASIDQPSIATTNESSLPSTTNTTADTNTASERVQRRKTKNKTDTSEYFDKPLTRLQAQIKGVTPAMVQDALDDLLSDAQSQGSTQSTKDIHRLNTDNEEDVEVNYCGVPIPDTEIASYISSSGQAVEPKTYKEAMTSPDSDKWAKAIADEYGLLMARGTWILDDLPPGRKPVGCRWVFKIKRNPAGQIERYKARLVAQGFTQRYGEDYFETYSPVAGIATIRLLMAWAVQQNMFIDQYDLEGAYLHGDIDTAIFMKQPEGYVEPGQKSKVCRIVRSLYGLRQSGRCWNSKFNEVMLKHGMIRSFTDSCVYIIRINEHTGVIPIYVDDSPAIASSQQMRKLLRCILMSEFKVRYLGPVNTLLGIQFTRFPDGSLGLNQTDYIKKLLTKYEMSDCNPAPTPLDPGTKLQKNMGSSQEEKREMEEVPYRQLIGALSYVARATRFDISFAVNVLAQFSSDPEPMHWVAAKRILRYLKGTLEMNLIYRKTSVEPHIYADASLGTDRDDRRSYSGIASLFGTSLINWHASKQKSVSYSTMEAEYRAIGLATKEALWMRNLLTEIGYFSSSQSPLKIYSDSQAAIAHAVSRIENSRSKYIDIACHFVREHIERHETQLIYVGTKNNLADVFTKPQQGPRHRFLISHLNVAGISQHNDHPPEKGSDNRRGVCWKPQQD